MIVQTGQKGKHVGVVGAYRSTKPEGGFELKYELVKLDGADFADDPEIRNMMLGYLKGLEEARPDLEDNPSPPALPLRKDAVLYKDETEAAEYLGGAVLRRPVIPSRLPSGVPPGMPGRLPVSPKGARNRGHLDGPQVGCRLPVVPCHRMGCAEWQSLCRRLHRRTTDAAFGRAAVRKLPWSRESACRHRDPFETTRNRG